MCPQSQRGVSGRADTGTVTSVTRAWPRTQCHGGRTPSKAGSLSQIIESTVPAKRGSRALAIRTRYYRKLPDLPDADRAGQREAVLLQDRSHSLLLVLGPGQRHFPVDGPVPAQLVPRADQVAVGVGGEEPVTEIGGDLRRLGELPQTPGLSLLPARGSRRVLQGG